MFSKFFNKILTQFILIFSKFLVIQSERNMANEYPTYNQLYIACLHSKCHLMSTGILYVIYVVFQANCDNDAVDSIKHKLNFRIQNVTFQVRCMCIDPSAGSCTCTPKDDALKHEIVVETDYPTPQQIYVPEPDCVQATTADDCHSSGDLIYSEMRIMTWSSKHEFSL